MSASKLGAGTRSPGKPAWTASILVAGCSAGLFSIVIYQVFNFFGVSWLLFANLLFMGFPLGGYLYLRFLDHQEDGFARSLTYLLGAMLVSILLVFLLKYPTSWWTSSIWSANAVAGLLELSLATALPFLPFFVAYGVMEVGGYRAGQRVFGVRANRVYSLYLFGLALGYAFFSVAIETLGLLRMALVALVVWSAARALLPGPARRLALAVLLVPGALLFLPGLEGFFFRHLHPSRLVWAGGELELGGEVEVVHERWERAGHLTLFDTGRMLIGAYVPVAAWAFDRGQPSYPARDLRRAVFRTLPAGADVLIIGTGGGRDVAEALEHQPRRVVAVEVRGSVLDALRGPLRDRVNDVYNQPAVEPVAMNGRKYVEWTERRFDLIYLPAVDGLVINTRTIFDASEYMHTVESFRAMRERLEPGGLVAVARHAKFDPRREQFDRVFTHMERVGLTPVGLVGSDGYVVLGFDTERGAVVPDFRGYRDLPIRSVVRELAEPVPPVHDDRPYRAGLPGAMVPERHIALLFGLQIGIFALLAAAVGYALSRRTARERWPVERGTLVMVAGILVGANFLALEYQFVFVLLRRLDQPFDAVFFATIAFLFLTGLGSLSQRFVSARIGLPIVALSLVAALALHRSSADTGHLLALGPAAFATGHFFPTVFGESKGRMLRVFAMDSVGAFLATVLAAFVPILLGFTAYLVLVMVLFLVTLAVVHRVAALDRGGAR